MYRIDFPALARQLLPTLLRKPRVLALADVLLAPVRDLYAQLLPYQADVRRELSYNAQVILFEKGLNDTFDKVLKRIRIDASAVDRTPFYVRFIREQQAPDFTHSLAYAQATGQAPRYLRTAASYTLGVGFIVRVPAQLLPADPEAQRLLKVRIEGFIHRLKVAATRHQTIYI